MPSVTSSICTFGFTSYRAAARFVNDVVSLVGDPSSMQVVTSRRIVRDDLGVVELAERLERGTIRTVTLGVGPSALELRVPDPVADGEVVTVRVRGHVAMGAGEPCWWQCDAATPAALPMIALPTAAGRWTVDAWHAWVALAATGGGLVEVDVAVEGDDRARTWRGKPSGHTPHPVVPSSAYPYGWTVRSRAGDDERDAVAWYGGPLAEDDLRVPPPAGWHERLEELLAAPEASLRDLREHLGRMFDVPFAWRVDGLDRIGEVRDAVTPEDGVVSRLVPAPDEVVVAVDLGLDASTLGSVLRHACAHLTLGHVRPGDAWSHWDTAATATDVVPRRHWDRSARALVDRLDPSRARRHVSSLAECRPEEKAWLVLHEHARQLVGETRSMHPVAERYQRTEYQRQAARRLIAQLDGLGGAMLCDGVGLGKTYVATTVIVHYVNAWRDLRATNPSSPDDPFLITVLSPHSVVGTWLREAIAPLALHGVPAPSVRVVSHSQLSNLTVRSAFLTGTARRGSDLDHLLRSDLVVVDEAHAFRSVGARRTRALRELLRLQPRRNVRRRVLLLTATPVNNGLEDLRQQASLMFATPRWLGGERDPEAYRANLSAEISRRLDRARAREDRDVVAALGGYPDRSRPGSAIDFRDDLDLGVRVARIGEYLREEERRLDEARQRVRDTIRDGDGDGADPGGEAEGSRVRVASELLDRIVVQRSRDLCKRIERERGSDVELSFRADAAAPEALVYEDVYDETRDVLARFLPLFGGRAENDDEASGHALTLSVYAWSTLRAAAGGGASAASLVGLQRVLALKRLESSPVTFLITVLRLISLHARRLQQLLDLAERVGDDDFVTSTRSAVLAVMTVLTGSERDRVDALITGGDEPLDADAVLARWSAAHAASVPEARGDEAGETDEIGLYDDEDAADTADREAFERLRVLADDLVADFGELVRVAPGLVEIVFGRFDRSAWPKRFVARGTAIDWPTAPAWGLRIVTDAKLRRLIGRLLRARAEGMKSIVFSQFTDTIAYLYGVLRATEAFDRSDWRLVLRTLAADVGRTVTEADVRALVDATSVITGDTEDREGAIDAFAPFYRLGPTRPHGTPSTTLDGDAWVRGWTRAVERPIDVLFASDVLAEGVNLQDASLLVNYDVHWNPVRMIQRTGRIDRRLDPKIEHAESYPDVEQLAERLGRPAPAYWWAGRRDAAPVTVNLLPPRDLEAALQLRERIAHKTLAIDFTMGLERGTGAEADWMSRYRYQGISALNAWQTDRAIERVAGYRSRLRRRMEDAGIDPDWVADWRGWLREIDAPMDADLVAWARFARLGSEATDYARHLVPIVADGHPHWLWTTAKPQETPLNFWLCIDGRTPPPANERQGLPWRATASRPLTPDALLDALIRVTDERVPVEERGPEIGTEILQGLPAIAAGYFDAPADRAPSALRVEGFRLLQLALPRTEPS